jgi:hypothetical protein
MPERDGELVQVVANDLVVGQKVMVLDAYGAYRPAVIRPVPRSLRDASGHLGWTGRGDFPKAFVQTRVGGDAGAQRVPSDPVGQGWPRFRLWGHK